jgi:hypothetical protein
MKKTKNNRRMAKTASAVPPEFFAWVKAEHGSRVSALCQRRLREAARDGQDIAAMSALEEVLKQYRPHVASRPVSVHFVY